MAEGGEGLRTSLIIPALDEEGAIAGVVEGFRQQLRPDGRPWLDEVVVVDNGSQDQTGPRAQAAGATVVSEPERGYGRACQAGLAHLVSRAGGPPEVVVFADGDGANDPEDLVEVLTPIEAGRAELVVGSRVERGDPGGFTVPQRFGNALAARLLRVLYGVEATDLGPFRAIRWSTLAGLGMADLDYGWTVEMQVRAARARVSTVEVAVRNRRRVAGRSKVSGTLRGVVGAGVKIIGVLVTHRR